MPRRRREAFARRWQTCTPAYPCSCHELSSPKACDGVHADMQLVNTDEKYWRRYLQEVIPLQLTAGEQSALHTLARVLQQMA